MTEGRGEILPIYFVGDESHSMQGEPISALNRGLRDLKDEVSFNPMVREKVRFGVLTFADDAIWKLRVARLEEGLSMPELGARGSTSYAAAFRTLKERIPDDVATFKSDGYEVHRPAVFFLSDGQPTDDESDWSTALSALKDENFKARPNVLAFGLGQANPTVIAKVATRPEWAFVAENSLSTGQAVQKFAEALIRSVVRSGEAMARGHSVAEFEQPEGFVQIPMDTI